MQKQNNKHHYHKHAPDAPQQLQVQIDDKNEKLISQNRKSNSKRKGIEEKRVECGSAKWIRKIQNPPQKKNRIRLANPFDLCDSNHESESGFSTRSKKIRIRIQIRKFGFESCPTLRHHAQQLIIALLFIIILHEHHTRHKNGSLSVAGQ